MDVEHLAYDLVIHKYWLLLKLLNRSYDSNGCPAVIHLWIFHKAPSWSNLRALVLGSPLPRTFFIKVITCLPHHAILIPKSLSKPKMRCYLNQLLPPCLAPCLYHPTLVSCLLQSPHHSLKFSVFDMLVCLIVYCPILRENVSSPSTGTLLFVPRTGPGTWYVHE